MVIGFHLLERSLSAVASLDNNAFSHLESIVGATLFDTTQILQTMLAGGIQLVLEGIEVVAPHLASHIGAHTFALSDNFDYTVVTAGRLSIHDTAGGRIIDARRRIVVGRLLHAVKRSDFGQFHFLSTLQQFND